MFSSLPKVQNHKIQIHNPILEALSVCVCVRVSACLSVDVCVCACLSQYHTILHEL